MGNIEENVILKDYKAVLAEGRNMLIQSLTGLNWSYTQRDSKVKEITAQIEKIDKLLES